MRHSPSKHQKGPSRGPGMRNRVGENRNLGRGRNDTPARLSGQEQRPIGPPRSHRRILRQMHTSNRKGKESHVSNSRRRRRHNQKANFVARNRRRGAFARNRRENTIQGRPTHRQDRNVKRRFRWLPPADFCESDDNLTVNVELPGVSQDDITVSVSDNRLTIKGKKKPNRSDNLKVRRSRRQFGRFRLDFPLPRDTEVSDIIVNFKDGILTVSVPKPETAKPIEIAINAE